MRGKSGITCGKRGTVWMRAVCTAGVCLLAWTGTVLYAADDLWLPEEQESSSAGWPETNAEPEAEPEYDSELYWIAESEEYNDNQEYPEADKVTAPDAEALKSQGAATDSPDQESGPEQEPDPFLYAYMELEDGAAVCMSGGMHSSDGHWYYRADNCGVRIVIVPGLPYRILFDGADRTEEAVLTETPEGAVVCTYSAAQVSSYCPDDGTHFIEVDTPYETGITAESSEGVETDGRAAYFLLDRVPPVCEVRIEAPEAAKQKKAKGSGRYYFNAPFRVTFSFSDANLDPALIEVRKGSLKEGEYDCSEAEIAAFPEQILLTGTEAVDEVGEDGLYRYLVAGGDKAGNLPIPGNDSFSADGATAYIALQQKEPKGTLSVLSDSSLHFSMNSEGKILQKGSMGSAEEAVLLFETDPVHTHIPVSVRCVISASPKLGSKKYKSKNSSLGAALRIPIKGRHRFRVKEWTMTDLAGNTCTASMPESFLLDPEPPKLSLSLETIAGGSVRLNISAEDPGKDRGGTGLSEVSCRISLGNYAQEETLYSAGKEPVWSWSGGTVADSRHFEGNDIRAEVRAVDRAGNTQYAVQTFTIDVTPPRARLVFGDDPVRNGMYFAAPREAVLEICDRNFDPDGVSLTGGEGLVLGDWYRMRDEEQGTVYAREITAVGDGLYEIRVSAEDRLGNRTESAEMSGVAAEHFVVDTIPPVVHVLENGAALKSGTYFPDERTFRFSVEDANYADEGEILFYKESEETEHLSFQDGRSETEITEDGEYLVEGSVTDLAGNTNDSFEVPPFVIDHVPPEIRVTGVEDGSANREILHVEVEILDEHLDPDCLEVSLVKEGGEEVTGGDLPAGTNGSQSETLSDRSEKTDDGYLLRLPAVEEDGLYRLRAVGHDKAGNETIEEVTFSENRNGTVFESEQGEIAGDWTAEPVKPSYKIHDVDEVSILSFSVNGEEVPYQYENGRIVMGETLKNDGLYKVALETMDAAGHRSVMEPETIGIDTTPPELEISGISGSRKLYFEPVEITLTSDDPEAEYAELTLDGKKLAPNDYTRAGSRVVFKVKTFGEHSVTAQLVDPAGNKSESVTRTFILTDDPWLRFTANPAVIVFAIAAAAFGAAMAVRAYRSRAAKKTLDSQDPGSI